MKRSHLDSRGGNDTKRRRVSPDEGVLGEGRPHPDQSLEEQRRPSELIPPHKHVIELKLCDILKYQEGDKVRSHSTTFRDFRCRILCFPMGTKSTPDGSPSLALFLEADPLPEIEKDPRWTFYSVKYSLTLVNQLNYSSSVSKTNTWNFSKESPDRGWHAFVLWKDLIDENKGWMKDGTVILRAQISVPHADTLTLGNDYDSRKEVGLCGQIYCEEHCRNAILAQQEKGAGDCKLDGECVGKCSCPCSKPRPAQTPLQADTSHVYLELVDVCSLESYVARNVDRRPYSAKKYLKLAQYHGGVIPQTYRYGKYGFGRRVPNKGKPSLQNITRECRTAAMISGRHEIWDIENCYPNIALQMVPRMRECTLHTLSSYCSDRDPFLREIADIYTYKNTNPVEHCTPTDAKTLFSSILSGGTLDGWKSDKNLEAIHGGDKRIFKNMPLFVRFQDDCRRVREIISKGRADLVDFFRHKRHRPKRTAQAYAFEEIEDAALAIAEDEVRKRLGINILQAPLFDGLIIVHPWAVDDEAVQKVFQAAESRILNDLGYRLKFSRKEWLKFSPQRS